MNWIETRLAEVRERNLTELDLSLPYEFDRQGPSPEYLAGVLKRVLELTHLRKLRLSRFRLKELPPQIARLEHLEELDLSSNLGLRVPKELARLTRLTALNLGGCNLKHFPFSLSLLPALEDLNLAGDSLNAAPAGLLKLSRLRRLNIDGPRTPLPKTLHTLRTLEELTIDFRSLLDLKLARFPTLRALHIHGDRDFRKSVQEDGHDRLDMFAPLTALERLEELELACVGLEHFPVALLELPRLKRLRLYGNGFSEVPAALPARSTLRAFVTHSNPLTRVPWEIFPVDLENLSLSGVPLGCFPPEVLRFGRLRDLELVEGGIDSLPLELGSLAELSKLNVSHNRITALPDGVALLSRLEVLWCALNALERLPTVLPSLSRLSLARNRFAAIPPIVSRMSSLRYLDLGDNQIEDVPDGLANLQNLEKLDLRKNRLQTLPRVVSALPRLKNLDLSDNPIEDVQPELLRAGTIALQDYLSGLDDDSAIQLFEAKLIVVGKARVGKSCLVERMIDPNADLAKLKDDDGTTRGIAVRRWDVQTPMTDRFRVNVWDFGGQEIYHATHQFFLTERSLYLFVWDALSQDYEHAFDYWLNVTQLLSRRSPLLVVMNKKDVRVVEIAQDGIKRRFPHIAGFRKVSAVTREGLADLVGEVCRLVAGLPHIGTKWPGSWTKVREALEADPLDYIGYEDYLALCARHGVGEAPAATLSGYLHDLGVILHFRGEPLLGKIVILKPEWGTGAVYRVLDTPAVVAHFGRFTTDELRRIWDDPRYPRERHPELLQLMMKFELCFRLGGTTDHVVPELLRPEPPAHQWDATRVLRFEYQYQFMPAGITTRFIARNHESVDGDLYWRYGVVLRWRGARARVWTDPLSRRLRVAVVGEGRSDLLAAIRRDLDHIHATLNDPVDMEQVPCTCPGCRANPDQAFLYDHKVLRQFLVGGKWEKDCDKTGNRVPIVELLQGIGEEAPAPVDGGTHANYYAPVTIIRDNARGQQILQGVGQMNTPEPPTQERSIWVSGSFFLVLMVSALLTMAAVANTVSPWLVPAVLVGGIVTIVIVGAFVLRTDRKLSEKNFLELIALSYRQVPLIGQLAGRGPAVGADAKDDPAGGGAQPGSPPG